MELDLKNVYQEPYTLELRSIEQCFIHRAWHNTFHVQLIIISSHTTQCKKQMI